MAEAKIFMSRPYHPEAAELLRENFEIEVWDKETSPPRDLLLEKVAESQALFVESYDRIDAKMMAAGKSLRVISNRAVGTDNLDIPEATKRGILLGNTPGILQESCADFTFALILDAGRRITFSDRDVRAGNWTYLTQTPYIGTDIHGKTLGIVGLGGIGHRVAKRARGFDMRIIYHSRTRKSELEEELGVEWMADLDSLLSEADYVSLHMPLTPETEGLIGKSQLERMKPEAFLINTSRGKTVDPKALYDALSVGTIAGAAIDVADPEPIPMDDLLLTLPNLVITPHIASGSSATFKAMANMAARNIIAALTGQPMPSCINPEALEHLRG